MAEDTAITLILTLLTGLVAVAISGITAILAFGFGAKIYSNIRQMLLESESSEKVQK